MSGIDDLLERINEDVVPGMPGGTESLRDILLDMAGRIQAAQDAADAASSGGVAPYSTPASIAFDPYWRRGGYRGAFTDLADLQASIPTNGYRGDFAMLSKGVGEPASIAIWDWEGSPPGWVETGPSPIIEAMIAAETARAEAAEAALSDEIDAAVSGEAAARSAAIATEVSDRNSAIAAAIAGLVGAAPGALDALNELAAAIGNDPNFAATVAAQIGSKQPAAAILTAISSSVNTQRLIGRNTAGSGTAEEVTASQVLDWLSNVVGSIAYRGAGGWTAIPPGPAGHLLASGGSGVAPGYVPPPSGSGSGDMVGANNLGDVASKPAAFDTISAVAEVNVAAAATTDIGAAASGKVNVTAGAAQIDAFGTAPAGTIRWIRFSASVLLKNNANIILPGGSDIQTQIGDVGYAISRGSNVWQVYSYVDGNTALERKRKNIPRSKRLEMFHDGTSWVVEKPDGSFLSTTGTTTSGLQEAINYACNNGLALFVVGEGVRNATGTQPVYIECTTGIVMPPVQHMMFHLLNVTVNLTPAVTGTGWLFNSFMMLDFVLTGQIVYAGTGAAVRFDPTTHVPLDTWVTACTDSRIRITQIACVNGASLSTVAKCVEINPASHSFLNCDFELLEFLGGAYAIDILNPGASSSFEQCRFTGTHIHQQAVGGIRIGSSATNAGGLRHNIWNIASIKPNGAGSIGFDTWGNYDTIVLGGLTNEEGTLGTGLNIRSGASYNNCVVGGVVGAATASIADAGTGNIVTNAGSIKIGGAKVKTVGRETLWVPAISIVPRTTNGPEIASAEGGTNKVMYSTLNFDASTIEYAQFVARMPKSWDRGPVKAQFSWSHPATSTNYGILWCLQGAAISDGESGDPAMGAGIGAPDTGGTNGPIYITPLTGDITIGGSPAPEDYVVFQVYRNTADGSDTLAVDGRLHGITLYFNTNEPTDA